MPRSDNLYLGNDSDHESFSEELSPSDGYFNRTNVPANVVPDPSISKDNKAEDKTLIPPSSVQSRSRAGGSSRGSLHSILPQSLPSHNYASHRSDNAPSSPSSYTPTSPASSRRIDEMLSERSTLMHGPPPAYSVSEAPLSPQSSEPEGRTYSTFPEHHLERGYIPRREPESMGGPIEEEPDETTPLSNEIKPEQASSWTRFAKHILLASLFVAIVVTISIVIMRHPNKAPSPAPIVGDPPFRRPVDAEGPYCALATHRNKLVTYEFPMGNDLAVLQTTHGDNEIRGPRVTTAGEIRLRRLPKDSQHGKHAYFTVDVYTTDPDLDILKTWDEEPRLLKISTPYFASISSPGPHCISVEITAWMPENAEFTSLLFESISLTLRVLDDIKMNVSGRSKFTTIAGQVHFPQIAIPLPHNVLETNVSVAPLLEYEHPFSSRRILVETVSGSIDGTYPLMDFLGLTTQAGQIDVDVNPEKVLKSNPKAADLEVQTSSGSIKVTCPVRYTPPPRNYITRVHSSAGSITGSFYIGSVSTFRSTSGGVNIEGLPVLQASSSSSHIHNKDKGRPNTFETNAVSGSTLVRLLDPIFISPLSPQEQPIQGSHPNPFSPPGDDDPYIILPPNAVLPPTTPNTNSPQIQNLLALTPRTDKPQPLDSLKTIHTTSAASIDIHYPSTWIGTVHAKSVSGSISASGSGLRIVRERKGYATKEILARKGVDDEDEGSWAEMGSIAGMLVFKVGEDEQW